MPRPNGTSRRGGGSRGGGAQRFGKRQQRRGGGADDGADADMYDEVDVFHGLHRRGGDDGDGDGDGDGNERAYGLAALAKATKGGKGSAGKPGVGAKAVRFAPSGGKPVRMIDGDGT